VNSPANNLFIRANNKMLGELFERDTRCGVYTLLGKIRFVTFFSL